MAPRKAAAMTPEERAAKIDALSPAWARDYIRQLEDLIRTLHQQLTEAREGQNPVTGPAAQQPSPSLPPGITAPQGGYATARVLDGTANMEPIADLPERAEVRWADYYQVRYGDHEITAGARVLIVETGTPLVIRPASQTSVIIARG